LPPPAAAASPALRRGDLHLSSKPISLVAWGDSVRAAPKCNVTQQAHSRSGKDHRCPIECPLFAEHRGNGLHCDFRCVEATTAACQAMNPQEPIVDLERGICRACMVYGCRECATDGREACQECTAGYELVDGQCHSNFFYTWVLCFLGATAVGALVIAWVVDLARRPIVNRRALDHALTERSRKKPHMPKDGDTPRALWPITTNLTATEVCGPGIRLAFQFQVFIMVWALIVAISWYILAKNTDEELLKLGTYTAENARQNCIVVAFGYETQRRLMFVKTCYMVGIYLFSFAFSVGFSIRQLRLFQDTDQEQVTYKDFAARIYDMPIMQGSELCEEEIRKAVEEASGQKVIGVSICWDFKEHCDAVMEALEGDLDTRMQIRAQTTPMSPQAAQAAMATAAQEEEGGHEQCWAFSKIEEKVFGSEVKERLDSARGEGPHGSEASEEGPSIERMLHEMKSTTQAFVVFETETKRNLAVAKIMESEGLKLRDKTCVVKRAGKEPASVQWQNCVEQTLMWKVKRLVGGFFTIFLALATWVLAFYAPYAYFLMSFNYAYGQEPGIVANLAFTMVVVIGNVAMYFVCSEVADRIGFQFNDDREVCYMLLYSFACMCNVALDMVVTYYMAYWMMVGVNMHTYHGRPLAEVHQFTERFETYAMQRSLGQNLMAYSFPSTFLVPFVLEPIATIYLPYKIMTFIVRAHKNISKIDAEKLLAAIPMDLSRYADVMLNVILAAMVFYFPGGFTHRMFFALAGSHLVIYLVDHYKVLRCIPACYFASDHVDWWAQWMLSIPCAIMLSALVFKANCQIGNPICLRGWMQIGACTAAFFLHIFMHTWALRRLVPKFGKQEARQADPLEVPYETVAKKFPTSWFSMNPVHCLRSQIVYKHDPPCDYCFVGKEHMLRVNPELGCYFQDDEAACEDYDPDMWKVRSIKDIRNLWAGLPIGADEEPKKEA